MEVCSFETPTKFEDAVFMEYGVVPYSCCGEALLKLWVVEYHGPERKHVAKTEGCWEKFRSGKSPGPKSPSLQIEIMA